MAEQRLNSLADRLEKVAARLESAASSRGGATAGAANENTEIVEEFEKRVLNGKLKTYFELSKSLGGEIADQALLVEKAFKAGKDFVVLASKHKTPKPDILNKLAKPIADSVNEVINFAEKRRGSKSFNHLFTVKDGIGCVGWVTVSPKPGPYVKESFDSSLFYGNRVIKDYKGKDDKHVNWMRAFTGAIKELEEYVKDYHKSGLIWNPDGTEAPAAAAGGPPPPPPGGAPPPPPPGGAPPPPPPGGVSTTSSKPKPDTAALFASINKGSNITKGLKKVTKDMQTHKNPELRASSVVKDSDVKKTASSSAPKYGGAPATKKPPKCELMENKWIVEYQEDNPSIEINVTDPKEAVYIFKCIKSTIKVNGKLNSIIIDSCKRVALVFETTISCVEAVNSQSVQIQVLNKCPTVSIDKTDGCQIYLSKESLNCEIVSAKSSEMNIVVPKGDDYSEFALPEQYKSVWNGKKFVTECTDING